MVPAQVERWILGVSGPAAGRNSGERATRSKPGRQGRTRAEPDRQMFPVRQSARLRIPQAQPPATKGCRRITFGVARERACPHLQRVE
jgi:hypothetical protein